MTLMKRLEAATSRLEDLTVFQAETLKKAGKSVTIDSDDKTIEDKEEDVTMKDAPTIDGSSAAAAATGAGVGAAAGAAVAAAGSGGSDASTPAFVGAFKSFIDELVDPFLSMSKAIGPLVEEQVVHLAKGFENELKFLEVASKSQDPKVDLSNPPPAFMDLFSPISKQGEVISSVRESNRGSNFINHLATVAEGTPALGWVIMSDPVQYITDFKDSAQFYANKVMKEFKETDKKQVEWAQQFIKILNGLVTYVKQYHQKGLSWNANGQPFDKVAASAGGASSSTGGATAAAPPPPPPAPGPGGPPPPPPPMPPASVFKSEDDSSKGSSSSGGMSAVFSEINKGESVTSGLRKVDKSEMTHKNPELRRKEPESGGAATSAKPAPPKKPAALSNKKPKKPARKELVDTKWIVENYENAHDIVIEVEMNQGVFIDRCSNCTIQLKGKANAVSVNECSKVGVLVDNLVAGVDIIKCSGFGVQITGKVPTVTIDQSNDGQVYLSSASVDAEIYTAQTSGLNINIPRDEAQGDYKEVPVPEQMVHRVVNGNLVTEIVEHAD